MKKQLKCLLRDFFAARPRLKRCVLNLLNAILGEKHSKKLISSVRPPSPTSVAPSSSPRPLSHYVSYNTTSNYQPVQNRAFTRDLPDFERLIVADAGFHIDFDLIRALRKYQKIDLIKPLSQDDYDVVLSIVLHIYLAYLRRFASSQDADTRSKRIIATNDINIEIKSILKSAEFCNQGYVDVIR